MSDAARLLVAGARWAQGAYHGDGADPARLADLGLGGVLIEGGPPRAAAELAERVRAAMPYPALIAASAIGPGPLGGLVPPFAALGGIGETEATRRAARLVARTARGLGINWCLAPPCGLSATDGAAFGAEPWLVAEHASEWVDALQAEGVLACATGFPGRRASGVDALYGEDLVPFRATIDAGVAGVSLGATPTPAIDASGAPAAWSSPVVQGLLREQLGFDGLVVADATALASTGGNAASGEPEAAVLAARAGADVVVVRSHARTVLRALELGISDARLDPARLRESAARQTRWAEWTGGLATTSPEEDERWLRGAAERAVRMVRGRLPEVRGPIEIASAASDGAPDPTPRFVAALVAAGFDARAVGGPTAESRAPLFIAVGPSTRAAEVGGAIGALIAAAGRAARDAVVVLFAPPSFAGVTAAADVIVAWDAGPVMCAATARWLRAHV